MDSNRPGIGIIYPELNADRVKRLAAGRQQKVSNDTKQEIYITFGAGKTQRFLIANGTVALRLEHFKLMYSRKNAQKSPNNYGPND
ncbi:MAG: hypothetical protein WC959_08220 [Kiritimatiellales bacterium]